MMSRLSRHSYFDAFMVILCIAYYDVQTICLLCPHHPMQVSRSFLQKLDHKRVEYEEGDYYSDGEAGTESQRMVMSTSRVHKSGSRSNLGADMECYNKARINRGAGKGAKRGKVLSSLALVGGAMVLTRGVIPWGVKVAALCLLQNVLKLPLLGRE